MSSTDTLPSAVRLLFWDYDARRLRWDRDRELVIGRRASKSRRAG